MTGHATEEASSNWSCRAPRDHCRLMKLFSSQESIADICGSKEPVSEICKDAKWSFCLTAGTMGPRIRRDHAETSTPKPHTGLQGEGGACCDQGRSNAAQLAEQFDVHPNQITSWKAQLEGGAADVFGPGGGNAVALPAVDVKLLHAKIGELTLSAKLSFGVQIWL